MSQLLGRTNEAFPPVWLSLAAPQTDFEPGWLDDLVQAAVEADTVIDVSKGAALWGGPLRHANARLMTIGGIDIETAADARHATDLLLAHLVQTLSAVGRERIDFYFLQLRGRIEQHQFDGALQALELARQDGHIRFAGLCCDGPSLAVRTHWQLADAFDVVLVPRNHFRSDEFEALIELANERRVGIVTSKPLNWGYGMPFVRMPVDWPLDALAQVPTEDRLVQAAIADLSRDHPVLVVTRTPEQILTAVSAPQSAPMNNFEEAIERYRTAWLSDESWNMLLRDADPIARKAAERRMREVAR